MIIRCCLCNEVARLVKNEAYHSTSELCQECRLNELLGLSYREIWNIFLKTLPNSKHSKLPVLVMDKKNKQDGRFYYTPEIWLWDKSDFVYFIGEEPKRDFIRFLGLTRVPPTKQANINIHWYKKASPTTVDELLREALVTSSCV